MVDVEDPHRAARHGSMVGLTGDDGALAAPQSREQLEGEQGRGQNWDGEASGVGSDWSITSGSTDTNTTPSVARHEPFFAFQRPDSDEQGASSTAQTPIAHPTSLAAYLATQMATRSPPGSPHSSTHSWPASEVVSYPQSMVGSVDGRASTDEDARTDASAGQVRSRLSSRGSSGTGLNAASELVMPRLSLGGRSRDATSDESSRPASSRRSSARVTSGLNVGSLDLSQHAPTLDPTRAKALVIGDVGNAVVQHLRDRGWTPERAKRLFPSVSSMPAAMQDDIVASLNGPFRRLYGLLATDAPAPPLAQNEDLAHLTGLWLERESWLLCVIGFRIAPLSSAHLDFLLELSRLVPVLPVFDNRPDPDAPSRTEADALAIVTRQLKSRRVPIMQYPVSSTAFDPPPPQRCVPSAVKRFSIWRRVEDAARGVSSRNPRWSGSESDEIEDGDSDRWAERVARRRESLARKRWTASPPPASHLRSEALESSISSLAESIASASVASDMSGSQTELSPCRPPRAAVCCYGSPSDPAFLLPGVPPVPVLLNIGLSIAWASLERVLARGCVLGLSVLRRADITARSACASVREAHQTTTSLGKHRSALKYLVGAGLGVLVAASGSEWDWVRIVSVGLSVGAAGTGTLQALGLV